MVADVNELAAAMRRCYEAPTVAKAQARAGASWLRKNQTWQHSANALIALMAEQGVFANEEMYA
jgi:hypothetical protein